MSEHGQALLRVEDLCVYYRRGPHIVRAVDNVTFLVDRDETVGLVGESGCGKSTVARTILRLERPTSGRVVFNAQDVGHLRGRALTEFRRSVQMVFQDPYGSLNPRMTVGHAIEEVLLVHERSLNRDARRRRVVELLESVGLDASCAVRYPHEFSGGQRQRIGIARALAVKPQLLIADEPVSALDVSVQVQILNLLKDLKRTMRLSYLFIAHDLAAVRYVSDRVLVMYLGRIVESGPIEEVYRAPAHPYTEGLLNAVPDVERALRERAGAKRHATLQGDLPSALQTVAGCPFHPRCPRAQARCRSEAPAFRALNEKRWSACHFAEEVLASK